MSRLDDLSRLYIEDEPMAWDTADSIANDGLVAIPDLVAVALAARRYLIAARSGDFAAAKEQRDSLTAALARLDGEG